jgi:mycoredoxin
MPDDTNIQVYGTHWCPDCHRARQVLDRKNIPYTWIDIENDAAAMDYIQKINGGYRSVPTIVFPDGSVLVEPANDKLEKKLAGMK